MFWIDFGFGLLINVLSSTPFYLNLLVKIVSLEKCSCLSALLIQQMTQTFKESFVLVTGYFAM